MPMTENWPEYFKVSLEKPLHPLWTQIDPLLREGQVALDLGCGVGSGTLHMLERGLKVIAVDQEPEAIEILKGRLPEGAQAHLVKAQFQDLGLDPASLDVVIAFFSLFLLRFWEFGPVWQRLLGALKPGGIFAGQILGVNDEWAERGYVVHTRAEVESLLHPFEILHFEEVERDGETLLREPKHWHIFHVVARKLEPA